MEINIEAFLDGIRARTTDSRWGIGVAASYLKAFAPCLEGTDACPLTAIGFNEPGDWQKALKSAESQMTYCAPDLTIKSVRKEAAVPGAIASFDHIVTSTRGDRDGDLMESKGAEIDEKMPLLWHHNIALPLGPYLGTKSQNDKYISGASAILDTTLGRDAAVLAEGGALRISHGFKPIEAEPIMGKGHIVVGFHVKRFRVMEVSLVSVPSNVDAVITSFSRKQLHDPLVSKWAGGLFDSRSKVFPGFTLETKSCSGDGRCGCGCKGKQEKAGEVVTATVKTAGETSQATTCPECGGSWDLTGVPSGYDVSKLSCPYCGSSAAPVKSAGTLETKVGATYSKKTKDCLGRLNSHMKCGMKELKGMLEEAGFADIDAETTGDEPKPSPTKSHQPQGVKLYGMSDNMEGSFQWVTEKLANSVTKFMRDANPDMPEGYCWVVATFADTAIIACNKYSSRGSDPDFHQANWEMDGATPKWTGDPTPVKLSVQIEKKLASAIQAGPLGIKNLSNMITAGAMTINREDAIESLQAVKGQLAEALGLLCDQRDADEFAKVFL